MDDNTKKYYSGTSGLVLKIPKTRFPAAFQDKSRLAYYSSLFNSIEVNSSFYKIPMSKTVAKWADSVTDDFRFTYKMWKGITHAKGLEFNNADAENFMQTISEAGKKKGCLLIQFPASVTAEKISQVKKLIGRVRKADTGRQWQLAIEFRHVSWYTKEVYDMLDKYSSALVYHDHPQSKTPFVPLKAASVYLRFHGIKGDYRGSYDDAFLLGYARRIHDWMQDGKTVFVYFNNTIGEALRNLETLNKFVSAGKPGIR